MWSSSDYSTLFYVLCFYVFLSCMLWASGTEIKVILSYLLLSYLILSDTSFIISSLVIPLSHQIGVISRFGDIVTLATS